MSLSVVRLEVINFVPDCVGGEEQEEEEEVVGAIIARDYTHYKLETIQPCQMTQF